ncbi:P-protein PheA [Thermoclostridium stercorarium subsp. stercorarium DSM 8532]|uniref:Bifunctional chorismate mutase/prephenate dehydratase n=3 Tax=Thermoclostridium stercorarium TaxID=1510 RepID=L7VPB2_THES1|nr:chorismate mutase [Thermoclostridium stercorarium]AGC68286.1 P-protein PheA [Thermoclostridium stercorarium subsp. stercorarium DSM 8532]AGI39315.1 chorismate mutase [Thermoclostridium stercorarium subsp. stercorarium DSM 8532]ANW98643.1 P-protein PheA [Thermoclostridium stercorarium subsp. thermolacticum DSM 2910]ANX01185.1 P-protein PheA [Thermoclostridium stercorarium subsp. leptospartum DSM 9219]UZQ86797.1 chorismate mutase [Thermoclostridium stercorarium]
MEYSIENLRERINSIDEKLVALFEERMETVAEIAEYKKRHGMSIIDPERENEVVKNAVSRLKNKELKDYVTFFIEDLMTVSKQYQIEKVRGHINLTDIKKSNRVIIPDTPVGFYGQAGSFSEEAAIKYFGSDCPRRGYVRFDEVITALLNGEICAGVLPVENSSTGTIAEVMDLIRDNDVYITGEHIEKIRHHLLVIPGTKLSEIKTVYSHHQGMEQCSQFLKQYPFEQIVYKSTADSAKLVKELGDKSKAAIGSERCAQIYGLEILVPDIHYNKNNYTRFIIIEREMSVNDRCNKISIIMDIKHRTGALFNVLRLFKQRNVNLLKIESRPIIGRPWEYMFFFDFEGNIEEDRIKNLIESLKCQCNNVRLLGNYIACETGR